MDAAPSNHSNLLTGGGGGGQVYLDGRQSHFFFIIPAELPAILICVIRVDYSSWCPCSHTMISTATLTEILGRLFSHLRIILSRQATSHGRVTQDDPASGNVEAVTAYRLSVSRMNPIKLARIQYSVARSMIHSQRSDSIAASDSFHRWIPH